MAPHLKISGYASSSSGFQMVTKQYTAHKIIRMPLTLPGRQTDGFVACLVSLNLIRAMKVSSKIKMRKPSVIPTYEGWKAMAVENAYSRMDTKFSMSMMRNT